MKRFLVVFKGQVQGVGFRWTISSLAKKYNVTGFVENLLNGDVLAQIQGNSDNLDALLQELFQRKGFIRIDDYSLKPLDIIEDEYYFSIR